MICKSRRATLHRGLALVLAVCLTALATGPALAKKPFKNGDLVQFKGNVVDAQGEPVADVEVQLAAARESFSFTRFKSLLYNPQVVAVRTDQFGSYTIDWKWHRYYNHFRIAAVVSIPAPGGVVATEVLTEVDLTSRLRAGSPVVTPLVLESTDLLETMRAFEATVVTSDERRVYREQGKPDRVETIDYPDQEERAWWYFELGTVYRFRDGVLSEVETFDPVLPIEG